MGRCASRCFNMSLRRKEAPLRVVERPLRHGRNMSLPLSAAARFCGFGRCGFTLLRNMSLRRKKCPFGSLLVAQFAAQDFAYGVLGNSVRNSITLGCL